MRRHLHLHSARRRALEHPPCQHPHHRAPRRRRRCLMAATSSCSVRAALAPSSTAFCSARSSTSSPRVALGVTARPRSPSRCLSLRALTSTPPRSTSPSRARRAPSVTRACPISAMARAASRFSASPHMPAAVADAAWPLQARTLCPKRRLARAPYSRARPRSASTAQAARPRPRASRAGQGSTALAPAAPAASPAPLARTQSVAPQPSTSRPVSIARRPETTALQAPRATPPNAAPDHFARPLRRRSSVPLGFTPTPAQPSALRAPVAFVSRLGARRPPRTRVPRDTTALPRRPARSSRRARRACSVHPARAISYPTLVPRGRTRRVVRALLHTQHASRVPRAGASRAAAQARLRTSARLVSTALHRQLRTLRKCRAPPASTVLQDRCRAR
jgi:hypothetical protein